MSRTAKAPESANVHDVADHYDELDPMYREIWGEHIHHGLWLSGLEPPEVAVVQMVRRVADLAGIDRGQKVCDLGCGYGAAARLLLRDYGARVTGITLSAAQYEFARARTVDGEPVYILGDWMESLLPARSFDAVVAIESVEHMADKRACFREVRRVLRPGGRFVFSTWLAGERMREWERRWLLEPICREGRLGDLGTADEHRLWLDAAGFSLRSFEDLSEQVKATWSICIRRVAARLWRDPRYRAYLLSPHSRNRAFARTLLRMWLAYETTTIRYALFSTRMRGLGGETWTGESRIASTASSSRRRAGP
jgi:tocopherol O-methyltransferase